MRVRDAFKTFPITGPCEIDREKMKKAFDILCRISVYHSQDKGDEYTFLQYTPKAKRKFRCTISEDDANWLIMEFGLNEVSSYRFRNFAAYVPCVVV